ncbi:DUF1569 domain-containing protein [Methylibium sp. Root1272]|uniref:DUF1569 domain-containing protein n=1 Tax=Methylibium sp. Root1272 TaxID=1736441 RepID=UPI0006F9AE48|nr:DUF1569 domain-containing protein [Methylibium sp. Root1272]KQW65583.1 hypothetical protein ASC67_14575 [Methylibium sp. Root1272]
MAAVAAGGLAGCAPGRVERFATWAEARNAVFALAQPGSRWRSGGAWSLSQTLQHLAQSIEGSLAGYPQSKPAWFTHTLGAAAHALFDARGRMTHPLDEPIPGAPVLAPEVPADAAALRLLRAMDAFESHDGALAPHFAYGALDKPAYARAHQMHLAAHWQQFEETRLA